MEWSPQQEKFFERTENVVGIGGAGGGGKSVLLLHKPAQQLEVEFQRFKRNEIAASKGWAIYFRKKIPNLQQAIARTKLLFPDFDRYAYYNEQSHIWTFPSAGNYRFQLAHLEGKDSHYDHKSNEYSLILWDELTEHEEEHFEYLDTRLRCSDPVLQPLIQTCWASNPEGRGLVWVRNRFIRDREMERVYIRRVRLRDGRTMDYSEIFIPLKLDDNPTLFASGAYEATLMTRPAHIRKAILEGNWWVNANSFFGDDWDERVHVCDDHEIPRGAFIFRSGDYGFAAPSSITWWYVDFDGCMTAFHNLYARRLDAAALADRIREIEQYYNLWDDETNESLCNVSASVLDPKCFSREASGTSIAYELKKRGVRFRPAKNDRINGIAQVIRRLRARTVNPTTGEEKALVRYMRRCKAPIETIPMLQPDSNDPELYDTDGEDHAADELRYACMAKPLTPQREGEIDDDDDIVTELPHERSRRAGKVIGYGAWGK